MTPRARSSRRTAVGAMMVLATLAAAAIAILAARSAPEPPAVGTPLLPPSYETPSAWTGTRLTLVDAAGPEGAVLATRGLPAPAFAVRAGETLHPAVAPGLIRAVVEVRTAAPASGQVHLGGEIEGGRMLIVHRGTTAHVDAAAFGERRRSLPASPVATGTSALEASAEIRSARSEAAAADAATAFALLARSVDALEPQRVRARGGRWPGREALAGRVLAERLGCMACHPSARPAAVPAVAPTLVGPAATRLRPAYVRRVLEDPASVRHHPRMPRLFDLDGDAADAERTVISDLVHFLAREQWHAVRHDRTAMPDRPGEGPQLWRSARCGDCHGPAGAIETGTGGEAGPIAMQFERVAVAGDLARALGAPHAAWPGGRMPDARLSPAASGVLAHWLVRGRPDADGPGLRPPAGAVERGARAFEDRGCVRCHAGSAPTAPTADEAEAGPTIPNAARLAAAIAAGRGCTGGTPRPGRPAYALDARMRAALAAWAREQGGAGAAAVCPPDDLASDLARLGCTTCHAVGAALPTSARPGNDLLRIAERRDRRAIVRALAAGADGSPEGRCAVALPPVEAAAVAARLRRAVGAFDDPAPP